MNGFKDIKLNICAVNMNINYIEKYKKGKSLYSLIPMISFKNKFDNLSIFMLFWCVSFMLNS